MPAAGAPQIRLTYYSVVVVVVGTLLVVGRHGDDVTGLYLKKKTPMMKIYVELKTMCGFS